ncbi:hypothetical protein PLICRDRAFT_37265 [Plicaturopsis crispa FD-325 SS-3]|nr:hypothetical protein PLICRDRAFT_37265 [Plicaturopsis crispa FD-325 SS-3]
MEHISPADIPLPQFLDPVLDYLSANLPPSLYSFLLTLLSHALALFTALFNLLISLASSHPSEWDLQTVLPPLISFLAAYLALVSLYRTTSWMFRTAVFFVKWGTIIAALAAGAGWYMGTNGGNGVGRGAGGGLASGLGGLFMDMMNGQGQNNPRARSQSSRTREKPRPKPWESFQTHQDWQYQENDDVDEGGNGAQKILGDLMGVMREGGWWEAAKSFVDAHTGPDDREDGNSDGTETRRKQPPRKAKTKGRNSRQR